MLFWVCDLLTIRFSFLLVFIVLGLASSSLYADEHSVLFTSSCMSLACVMCDLASLALLGIRRVSFDN